MSVLTIRRAATALAVLACAAPAPAQSETTPRDLAAQVRGVFAAKCVNCHGPTLVKPKGRFGYVLDLHRVAGNPEMVIPHSPDESDLWVLVSRDEMPPPESPTGPLTSAQKEVIRAWIQAGAPADDTPPAESEAVPETVEPSARRQLQDQLGYLHLPLTHFPVALLIAAVVAEFWLTRRGDRTPPPAVHFCVLLGGMGAVAAAAFGWVHAGNGHGGGQPQVLDWHRWLGTATAAWAVVTVAWSAAEQRAGVRGRRLRVWLTAGAALVGAAAHLGGVLVHGAN